MLLLLLPDDSGLIIHLSVPNLENAESTHTHRAGLDLTSIIQELIQKRQGELDPHDDPNLPRIF